MPATRRARGASKTAQRTLGFTHSKSTKPLPSSKDLSPTPTPSPAVVDVGHVSSEAAVAQQAAVEVTRVRESRDRSVEELQAKQVTDAQIRRYWREREAERIAPRVHQQDLSVEEKILRLFDMSSQYGPAIGIARMKRWVRANKLGLAPPIEVLAVLLKEEEKENHKIERAYVDELMSSKFVVGEA